MEGLLPTEFDPHSFRENILALGALSYYRKSRWALQQGQQMLETIQKILQPDCSWNFDEVDFHNRLVERFGREKVDYFEYRGRRGYIGDANVAHNGRLIEGLVWFYEMTGSALAMELADKLSRFHLEHTTYPDGSLNTEIHPEHTHSYLNTLKGLLRFGLLTNQRQYVEAVAATYRVTVKERIVKESGFASHDFLQDCMSETASPADAAQIAMWLALNGYAEFFDDVERIVRARLLPSQITESPELQPALDEAALGSETLPPNARATLLPPEEYENLEGRIIGGYACGMRHPNSRSYVYTDVTSAVLHSLIDIYHNIVIPTGAGLTVNLHFDYEDETILISSERKEDATLTVIPKINDNVLIRIPGWAPKESLRLVINGKPVSVPKVGDYFHISKELLPGEIVLKYGLPIRTTVEKTQGIEFTYTWRGDNIIGVSPNTDLSPFYPSTDK